MKYAVLSDIHAHAFTLFGRTMPDGVSSRLRIILDEMIRAAEMLAQEGGRIMVIAGDILHTRGQIDPEVLNPLRATVERILDMGIDIYAIPGNHDLKSADTSDLSSSVENLRQISPSGGTFTIFNRAAIQNSGDHVFAFVPWRAKREDLLSDIEGLAAELGGAVGDADLFIHAGIDGVLPAMPDHGLSAQTLADFGFRRVFAGHYHNHKDFGNGVVSIGATTHHNWGDVGTACGFLIVDGKDGSFEFHHSNAPRFMDLPDDADDWQFVVPNNYVRVRGRVMTEQQIEELRGELVKLGAAGISIEVPRAEAVARSTRAVQGRTLEQSIEDYIASVPPKGVDPKAVAKRAMLVLADARAVTE